MKNYSLKDYPNYEEFCSTIVDDLNNELCPVTINTLNGQATITEVLKVVKTSTTSTPDFSVNVYFTDGHVTKYYLVFALNKFLRLDAAHVELITKYYNQLVAVYNEQEVINKADIEAARNTYIESIHKAKEEADLKKTEIKQKALIKKKISEFETTANTVPEHFVINSSMYYSLGWLAKHVSTISTAMPDYLEPAFIREFGPDQVHRVVNSKLKTSGGFSYQWSFGFDISFKKDAITTMPATLLDYVSSAQALKGNKIHNTAFVCYLVKQFGFTFGKEQNIDLILENVPDTYIDDFKAGFAA